MKIISLFLIFCWANVSTARIYEEWNRNNSPYLFPGDLISQLDLLPRQGSVQVLPWSGHYWGDSEGGIAQRWQVKDRDLRSPFSYQSYDLKQLKELSEKQIGLLSPAEKFDIFQGRYDYPLLTSEISRTSPTSPDWFGLCDGLSSSSVFFLQPGLARLINKDGIVINFYSSDIKALLSYFMSFVAPNEYYFVGERCSKDLNGPCDGINAGSFHIILSNYVGLSGKSFIADLHRNREVWNHAISSYSTILNPKGSVSSTSAPGTVLEYYVDTTIKYAPHLRPQQDRIPPQTKTITYRYTIELDVFGRIIGGEWISQNRPDFLWVHKKKPAFTGYFKLLDKIYSHSLSF